MVCYYHQSAQAVGICKNCHKGICAECAVDVGNGLACKGHCESEVAAINNVFERGKIQYQDLGSIYGRNALWMGGLGIAILLVVILLVAVSPESWLWDSPLIVIGIFLLISAAMNRAQSQKHTRLRATDKTRRL
jgi:hypothetical protein